MVYKSLPKAKPNKQIREYLDAVRKGGRLVAPNGDGWRVTGPDGRSIRKATKEEAITQAEKELAGTESKVFIFNNTGELVDSYIPQNPRQG